jgi:hypothetical protein
MYFGLAQSLMIVFLSWANQRCPLQDMYFGLAQSLMIVFLSWANQRCPLQEKKKKEL